VGAAGGVVEGSGITRTIIRIVIKAPKIPNPIFFFLLIYSHSIVEGGLEVIS